MAGGAGTMTEAHAQALTAKLLAAFPRPEIDKLTVNVYSEQIATLAIYECALDAINDLISSEMYRPPVALVIDTYRRLADRYAPQQLREPPMSEEQRQENLRQSRALLARLSGSLDMQ